MSEKNTPVDLLDFESAYESATSTILLIHGAGSSGLAWDIVQPHLSSYHLLMPSLFTQRSIQLARRLPTNATASPCTSTTSTTISTVTSPQHHPWQRAYIHLLASLVRTRAHNSRAHIVGLSMGASLALAFAANHPELTLSVFVSGLPTVKSPPSSPLAYSLLHAGLLGVNKLQDFFVSPTTVQRLLDGEVALHPGGWDGAGQCVTSELMWIMMDIVRGFVPVAMDVDVTGDVARTESGRQPLRVFILAATRTKWWMPVGDSVEWAVEVAKRLVSVGVDGNSSGNGDDVDGGVAVRHARQDDGLSTYLLQVKALEAKRMFHPWSRQAPEVFAQCILATAEGTPLPDSEVVEVWSHSTGR